MLKKLDKYFLLRIFWFGLLFGIFAPVIRPVQAAVTEGVGSPVETIAKNLKASQASAALDDLGRDTPRGAVEGFLSAAKARNYERAAYYLDLSDLFSGDTETEGPQLAKDLRMVLEQTFRFDPRAIDDSPEGRTDDGLLPDQERVGVIDTPGKTFDLMLERVLDGGPVAVWKISQATVEAIPDMTHRLGFGFLGKFMPEVFFEFNFLGITFAEWLFLIIMLGASTLFSWLVIRFLVLLAGKFQNKYVSTLIEHLRGPLWALLTVLLIRAGFKVAAFSAVTQAILRTKTAVYLFGIWFIFKLIDFFILHTELGLKQRGMPESAMLIKFVSKVIKTCVVIIGVTLWLENIGFKISTLLAGIGIGGIAFALAAQKSIEDLFGAVTIVGYRPLKLGEFIGFGDKMGTVVEIGVRYTRIRTLDRTILNVPNGQLASLPIENFSRRDKFRYLNVIDLGYETTSDHLRYILMELRTLLYSDARVSSDPPCWARFKEFGAYSLKVEVGAWLRTSDIMKYREIAEDLNLKIMELVQAAGARFAFPTQIQYRQDNAPVDQELVKKAEEQVEKWRAEGKLFMDEFPREEIARLRQQQKK